MRKKWSNPENIFYKITSFHLFHFIFALHLNCSPIASKPLEHELHTTEIAFDDCKGLKLGTSQPHSRLLWYAFTADTITGIKNTWLEPCCLHADVEWARSAGYPGSREEAGTVRLRNTAESPVAAAVLLVGRGGSLRSAWGSRTVSRRGGSTGDAFETVTGNKNDKNNPSSLALAQCHTPSTRSFLHLSSPRGLVSSTMLYDRRW